MHLVYIGQSGQTGASAADPCQPHEVVAGLMLHETQNISVNGEYDALCRRHFGAPLGQPGAPNHIRPVDLYQGLRHFAPWPPQRRTELIQDCLGILIRRETPVIVACLDKRQLAAARAQATTPAALLSAQPIEPIINRFLLALSMYLDEMGLAHLTHDQLMAGDQPVTQLALTIAQQNANIHPRLMNDFLTSDEGQDATALHENICYLSAAQSPALQLANLCAYLTRRWLQTPQNPHPHFETLRDNRVLQVIYPVTL